MTDRVNMFDQPFSKRLGLALFLPVLCACNTKPGALVMTVEPTKPAFTLDEPVILRVTLRSKEGAQALWRNHDFKLEALADDGRVVNTIHPIIGQCGGVGLLMLPFLPVVQPYRVLDVTDTLKRFVIITEDRFEVRSLRLTPTNGSITYDDPSTYPQSAGIRLPPGETWKPARYTVTVSLENPPASIYYPAPLFWTPYSSPVSATTKFSITKP